ncbi:hypothetical protein TWF694_003143 [Orbilia ellipsospora]|uniref:Uncharacterized protein n=1 Tax=Orbilia ellipsospora TaxID=2528407 RepID=A0AAV9X224_9PEZI
MNRSELVNQSGDMEGWVQGQTTKEREPVLSLRNRQKTSGDCGDGAISFKSVLGPHQSKDKRVKKTRLQTPRKAKGQSTVFKNPFKEHLLEAAIEAAGKETLAPAVYASGDPPEKDQDGFNDDEFVPSSEDEEMTEYSVDESTTVQGEERDTDMDDNSTLSRWSSQPTDSRSSVWSGIQGNPAGPSAAIVEYNNDPHPRPFVRGPDFTGDPQILDHRGRPTGVFVGDFEDFDGSDTLQGSMNGDGSQQIGVESDCATVGGPASEEPLFTHYQYPLDISEDGESVRSLGGNPNEATLNEIGRYEGPQGPPTNGDHQSGGWSAVEDQALDNQPIAYHPHHSKDGKSVGSGDEDSEDEDRESQA